MAKSRLFVAISFISAASLAASSVAAAPLLAPVVPADAAANPAILKIDRRDRSEKWEHKREHKSVQWERSYRDHREPGRSPAYRERGGRGDRGDYRERRQRGEYRGDRRGRDYRRYRLPPPRTVIVRPVPHGPRIKPPPHRRYHYRDIWVYRPYGHWYSGYGYHYHDRDAYPWLAFTAITLGLLGLLTIAQQRAQEQAQIDATTAPVGSTVRWNDANAAGSVSVLRDGRSSDGQYCREFQQTVTVGGRSEQAYGVACRQPDGAWRIVKTQ